MSLENTIIHKWVGVATADDPFLVEFDPRPPGLVVFWTRMCARCIETDPAIIELGVKRGSQRYFVRAASPAAAALSVHAEMGFMAPGDFVPYAEFTTITEGDQIEVTVFGYLGGRPPLGPE